MNLIVFPGHALKGSASLPADKSISHRAILFAAMAKGESHIEEVLLSGVTRPMLDAIQAFGVEASFQGTHLTVRSAGWRAWRAPIAPLHCGNSATTLRLLAGALAAAGVPAILDGSEGLRRRPMDRLIIPLRKMGVPIRGTSSGTAPLVLEARSPEKPLKAIEERLPVATAQVKTALLLAALSAEDRVTVTEPFLSRDHAERLLRAMGVSVETTFGPDGSARHCLTPPKKPLDPFSLRPPADFSSAAFLIVGALITPGSHVRLSGVGLNPGRTGLLETLREMGGTIRVRNVREIHGEPLGDIEVRHSPLRAAKIRGARVPAMIDEFPAFAAAAACADGISEAHDAEELRVKESDRIAALCSELRKVGVEAEEYRDGFRIVGRREIPGGKTHPHGDHRLAMAMAVLGLAAANPIIIESAEITEESFPDFSGVLQRLGADVRLEQKK